MLTYFSSSECAHDGDGLYHGRYIASIHPCLYKNTATNLNVTDRERTQCRCIMSDLLKCVIISDPVILGPACRHPLKIFYDTLFYYTNGNHL